MSEANAITAGLLDELPKRYLFIRVWRNNRVKTMAIGRGGKPRMISAGVDGQADISGIIGPFGRRVEIEVKAGRDPLSDAQKAFRSMIIRLGGVHVVARDVDGALEDLALQLQKEERETHIANLEGGGQLRPTARARKKRDAQPKQALPTGSSDYGGPAGGP